MKFSSGQVNYSGRILQRLGVKSVQENARSLLSCGGCRSKRDTGQLRKDLPKGRLYDSGNESLSDI